jgi:regulator of protease activity HflC (stomatin/prohibitin superfamily)
MNRARVLLIGLVAMAGVSCASVNTRPDQAAIAYTGGPIEGTHFQGVFQPGSGLQWLGLADESHLYPTTVRTYIISSEASEGDKASIDFIGAPTKDGVEAKWELAITFKLNVSRIRRFHENIGLTRKAWFENDEATAGWRQTLNDFFRQQIENALQEVSRTVTADEVQRGAETFGRVNTTLGAQLKDRINQSAGGNFFCGPTFNGPVAEDDTSVDCPNMQVSIKKVTLPDEVVDSYAAQKIAENGKITAENEGQAKVVQAQRAADATKAEAEGKAAAQAQLADIYKDPAYLEYLRIQAQQTCAQNPPCLMGASGVNLNVP